jgi:hypothetical protein
MKTGEDMSDEKLVDAKGLLQDLFPESCRPTERWVRDRQADHSIPFMRVGRLIFFSPTQVRKALAERHGVPVRGSVRVRSLPS